MHRPTSSRAGKSGSASGKPARLGYARSMPRPGSVDGEAGPGQAAVRSGLGWREVIEQTVTGLGYELVDVERAVRGLLRISIDRVPGHSYPTGESEFVTIEDCEAVTRQLQYVLEVEGLDYARLEVSSPGLDRPLRTAADYARFAGQAISLTLKEPFQGRKQFKGVLEAAPPADGAGPGAAADAEAGWTLVFQDGKLSQVLSFALHEVRDARLVPVLDFKGRQGQSQQTGVPAVPADAPPGADGGQG